MCGICGVITLDRDRGVERSGLEAMNRQIAHRGPDDDGFYVSGNVGLAMRRLSIIDVQAGHQPLSNEDGTVWVVYNGEIYNHQDLRPLLEERGHRYRTRTDTETIVHLYEEYGRDCVRHLRGMFAFALWDSRRRRLFVARDRLGIKPFYYHHSADAFLFGSEIKAILAYPSIQAEFNRAVLPEYLAFGYLAGPDTFFTGVRKLLPGHTLELDEGGKLRIERYWDLTTSPGSEEKTKSFCINTYREMLEGAVSSHLMSDVPLGVFLSGGVDSSAVAALMTKIRREPIQTFSVGYEEAPYSELPYAGVVAKHIGSVHHEVRVSCREFFDALPKLIWHEDEPIVWPSSVALYFVAQLAREHVTVVLTGEGSDETLAGYTRYPWTLWNSRLDSIYRHAVPGGLRRRMRAALQDSAWIGADVRRKLSHSFLARDGNSWASFYFENFYCAFSAAQQAELLGDDLMAELRAQSASAYQNSLAYWDHSSGELIGRLLYTDIKTYLVELLMKQDNMSMAASIESRVPFLDHVLVEFAASIPARFQTRGLEGKLILKAAVEDLLPDSIIHRRKLGFPTPWSGWLAGAQLDFIEGLLVEPRSLARGLFKPESLRRLFAEHRARHVDHYDRIWRLLNLELWHRAFIDCDVPGDMHGRASETKGIAVRR
ncbi:MAG TPA: asparagine synthase (glutamine-hydrolyzing) [Terriglobia bacterium]|nr:asparagine synthase (glutamine-hydrolyzing) [Terriglobia bacterium]